MNNSEAKVTCPNCNEQIDVNHILSKQLEEKMRIQYSNKEKQLKEELESKNEALLSKNEAFEREKLEFEQKKKKENELFSERVEQGLKLEKGKQEIFLRNKILQEQEDRFKEIQQELNEKSVQVNELNKTKIEIERLKRANNEMQERILAETELKFNKQLVEEREKIRKGLEDKSEMHILELKKQLEDQKKLTEEMKRKQEQGSMQLQGEVQELAIEEWLRNEFRLDNIEEVKKGARGADCLQIVHTHEKQNCGTIYYESKRTKDFQPSWIEKFKADIRDKNVDIGVLITDAMPSGMERLGLVDGIWICTFAEFKGLCIVLRDAIVRLNHVSNAQENRGEKMHMLYDFLTGNTFRMQVEAIVEGFTQMQRDLDSEKRSFAKIWKQRERQLDKVLKNTVEMHGNIRGIAGNAIQAVKALELDNIVDENLLED